MDKIFIKKSYIELEATYPHNLLIHLRRLINNDRSLMKDRDTFLDLYAKTYEKDQNEMKLLSLAYEKNIVNGFFKCLHEPEWRKRVLVEETVNLLVEYLEEKDAVVLVESFMFVFGFVFSLKIERKWETPAGKRADFHGKMEHIPKKELEVWDQIKARERNNGLDLQIEEFLKTSEENGAEVYGEENINPRIFEINSESPEDGAEAEQAELPDAVGDVCGKVPAVKEVHIQDTKCYKQMTIQDRRTLMRAFQGNAASQCKMGEYYSDKTTDHLDLNEAAKWYSVSARNGYVKASFALAKLYDQNSHEIPGGKEKSLQIYSDMANQGFPTAQCILGMKYWYGDGVEEDVLSAIKWLKKAAIQKHGSAIKSLADLYLSINDIKNARKWYGIGADAGDLYCKDKVRRFR